jgi:Oligonucleotide/oligosaccharide-binding (OB)-fold
MAHRRFYSHEGDIPTLLRIYKAWRTEALYLTKGDKKTQKKALMKAQEGSSASGKTSGAKLLHGDWCSQNYINGRALVRACDVRKQLRTICHRAVDKNGLGMDVESSCADDMEVFLKCVCAGLFLQSAARLANASEAVSSRGSGSINSSLGRYKTKVGKTQVSIHPTSTLFARNPAPKCVVFTELLVTKKTYIRGVTQIREEWLADVAPKFFNGKK